MILKKIILENFRNHKYFEFEPIEKGITAISGKNGAGKSTIVNALSWTLFGSRLQGLKNLDYIRIGVNPKERPVQVTIFLEIGNREYMIRRRILNEHGTSDCMVYSKPINTEEDFMQDAGPTVTHAENFIKNLLGYDEKRFFYSVFIQQKQVDQIINASAREKGQVIEQLLGINTITKAMDLSKSKSKEFQKAADIVQSGSVEDEKKKVVNQKNKVIKLLNEFNAFEKGFKDLVKELNLKEKIYKEEAKKQEKANLLISKKNILEAEVEQLQNFSKENLENYQKISVDKGKPKLSLNIAQKNFDSSQKNQIDLEIALKKVEAELVELNKLFQKEIDKNIEGVFEKTEKEREKLEKESKDLEVQIEINKIKGKNLKEYLNELENNITSCPMCGNEIINIEEEKKKHKDEFLKLQKETKEKSQSLEEITKKKNELLNYSIELKYLVDIFKEQNENKKKYLDLQKEKIELETKRNSFKIELEKCSKILEEVKLYHNNIEMITKLKESIKKTDDMIKLKTREINNLIKDINEISSISQKDFKAMTKEYDDLKSRHQKAEISNIEKKSLIEQEKTKGKLYLEGYNKCVEAVKKYNEITTQVAIYNEITKSLSDFKSERIEDSIPKLNSIASEILNKFTEGDFIKLELDSDFEISVLTKDGIKMEVEKLSGGELSTVAIALRIAISLFLYKGEKSLLVLDEVLVSMSEERSYSILETISSLAQSQIIIIAHSPIINDIADLIITI